MTMSVCVRACGNDYVLAEAVAPKGWHTGSTNAEALTLRRFYPPGFAAEERKIAKPQCVGSNCHQHWIEIRFGLATFRRFKLRLSSCKNVSQSAPAGRALDVMFMNLMLLNPQKWPIEIFVIGPPSPPPHQHRHRHQHQHQHQRQHQRQHQHRHRHQRQHQHQRHTMGPSSSFMTTVTALATVSVSICWTRLHLFLTLYVARAAGTDASMANLFFPPFSLSVEPGGWATLPWLLGIVSGQIPITPVPCSENLAGQSRQIQVNVLSEVVGPLCPAKDPGANYISEFNDACAVAVPR